jgi:tripartite-type tricarboxylate transporter receptor subunit TctC
MSHRLRNQKKSKPHLISMASKGGPSDWLARLTKDELAEYIAADRIRPVMLRVVLGRRHGIAR